MLLILLGILLAAVVLYMGMKFYRSIDWNDPAEPGPDLRAMRQRELELQRIQEVLAEAYQQDKLSKSLVEEFNRFCEAEIDAMKRIEKHSSN